MPKEHQFERASAVIADWLDSASTKLADGLKGGGRAPFAAPATDSEKLAYYESKMFNPDGTDNVQGGMEEMHRLGVEGYARAKAEVLKARQDRMMGEYRQNAAMVGG